MPNLTFRHLTTRPLADGRCRVLLDITWNDGKNQRVKLPTGVRCLPAHFSSSAKLGKHISTRDKDSSNLNNKLATLAAEVLEVFTLASTLRQPIDKAALLALNRPEVEAAPEAEAAPPQEPTFTDLYQEWKREHAHSSSSAQRRYKQVVGHLEKFHPGMKLSQLTRQVFLSYTNYLHGLRLTDGTVGQHIKFLRICHRIMERHIPTWLVAKVRHGRPPAFRQDELQAIRDLEIPEEKKYLERERERVLFQTQLLLRDSDLRKLKPHSIVEDLLPDFGRTLLLCMHQKKTGDEVRLPLPPLAAQIWATWGGVVPVVSQQNRNRYIKELAKLAGLTRTFVKVRFESGEAVEEPMKLHEAVSTHTPRHTGADMILWGSDGDQNLKEVALGHTAGGGVYGYDILERYGPMILRAWKRVGAMAHFAPTPARPLSVSTITCAPTSGLIKPTFVRLT